MPVIKQKLKFDDVPIDVSEWLDIHRSVEQMTWAPGEGPVIRDKLVDEGGWIDRPGCTIFNLYRPPTLIRGDADLATKWIQHVEAVYGAHAGYTIRWLAHRVQNPGTKINHALVLGGKQGIGKDTILEPVKYAIGPWNFAEVTPVQMLGRFNGFLKSVILRVSEARDLGDVDRYAFYDTGREPLRREEPARAFSLQRDGGHHNDKQQTERDLFAA